MSNTKASPGLMENFSGTFDIMLSRSSGLKRIDLSKDGFYWSFAALLLTGLIDAVSLSILFNGFSAQQAVLISKSYFVFGNLVIATVGYAASLLALYLLCREPIEIQNFSTSVIVHNWASPIVSLAFLPLIILSVSIGSEFSGSPNGLLTLVTLLWLGVLVFVGIRIMRISLDISLARAGQFFAATALVSLVLTEGLEKMAGISLAS